MARRGYLVDDGEGVGRRSALAAADEEGAVALVAEQMFGVVARHVGQQPAPAVLVQRPGLAVQQVERRIVDADGRQRRRRHRRRRRQRVRRRRPRRHRGDARAAAAAAGASAGAEAPRRRRRRVSGRGAGRRRHQTPLGARQQSTEALLTLAVPQQPPGCYFFFSKKRNP